MTVREALANAGQHVGRRDAEVLLRHVLGCERTWLLAHPEAELGAAQAVAYEGLLVRRAAREPLQYLVGEQEFYGLTLRVSPAVLIPRPETELLVEQVLAWAARQSRPLRIVDVGTGSGAIALALAAHLPDAAVTALDLSPPALSVARTNAERLGLAQKVRFGESDLLAAVAGEMWDAVVSNPPYVPAGDAATLQAEVVGHEPHTALFAGEDGLAVYRRLIPAAAEALRPGGLLAMEFGFGQRDALRELLAGWNEVRFYEDLAGIPRAVLATRPALV